MSDLTDVGTGVNLFTAGQVRGTARWFNDTADVLSIDDDDLEDTIALVNKGGMTFLSPILPDLRAIVCTAGSRESHLAILSRESDVPACSARRSPGTSPTATFSSSICPRRRRPGSRWPRG